MKSIIFIIDRIINNIIIISIHRILIIAMNIHVASNFIEFNRIIAIHTIIGLLFKSRRHFVFRRMNQGFGGPINFNLEQFD